MDTNSDFGPNTTTVTQYRACASCYPSFHSLGIYPQAIH